MPRVGICEGHRAAGVLTSVCKETEMTYDHRTIMDAIRNADQSVLEELASCWSEFPAGVDDFIGNPWITNAISCGNAEVVAWMLSHGATPKIEIDDG